MRRKFAERGDVSFHVGYFMLFMTYRTEEVVVITVVTASSHEKENKTISNVLALLVIFNASLE